VAVAVNELICFVFVALTPTTAWAAGPELDIDAILSKPAESRALKVTSVSTRISAYQQNGRGYQSKAGPAAGPGSERLTVFEPQLEVQMKQGDQITHRLWIPVDIVTAASPDAIDRDSPDVVSQASRQNEAGTIDWSTQYRVTPEVDIAVRSGVHLEEEWRSWHVGLTATHAFAEHNTSVSLGVFSVIDWFDRYSLTGPRIGLGRRGSNTASVTVSQVLSRTTLMEMSYGLTLQSGELGNTWNIVPLANGDVAKELLPEQRVRHAWVLRLVQALPTQTFVKGYYCLYSDSWSIAAHTMELEAVQRLSPTFNVGLGYRHHQQAGAEFFTRRATGQESRRTADSDLAELASNAISAKVALTMPWEGAAQLHADFGFEHYWRTNNLQANVATCSVGLSF
jgi:Protein of unknown function (DUF3570)